VEEKLVEGPNTRRYRRIPVGSDHTVSFSFNGKKLKSIPLANLSAGGCLAVIPQTMVPNVRHGYLLMDFGMEHKELSGPTFCSRVVHVVRDPALVPKKHVGLGISFLSTSPNFYERLEAYVSAQLSSPVE
jgi:hypothetical protein